METDDFLQTFLFKLEVVWWQVPGEYPGFIDGYSNFNICIAGYQNILNPQTGLQIIFPCFTGEKFLELFLSLPSPADTQ